MQMSSKCSRISKFCPKCTCPLIRSRYSSTQTSLLPESTPEAPIASTSTRTSADLVPHGRFPRPGPKTRLVASAVVSRPPLTLQPLTDFERTYYSYQRKIQRALSGKFEPEFYFRTGSAAEKSFLEMEKKINDGEDIGEADLMPTEVKQDSESEESLRRKLDRTLYLLLKKDRKEYGWQFPQGGIEETDNSLPMAALRELLEECGPDMDVWPVGSIPAAVYAYRYPERSTVKSANFDDAMVFFSPIRILRGQVNLKHPESTAKAEGITQFAWLTREEIEGRVKSDYFEAIEPLLSSM